MIVWLDADEPKTMRVERTGKGEVRASDVVSDPAIEVINGDLVLATLTDDVHFEAEMTVARGRGYMPAQEMEDEEQEIGVIPLDAIYSQVMRVRYKTEDTRVGQRTNYDRLLMDIWTKGTVSPEMALVEAAKILRKHLNPFVQYFELGEEVAGEPVELPSDEGELDPEVIGKLNMAISELDLSVRAAHCLEMAKIVTVGALVQMSELDLLGMRSFGKTSLREVKRKLADLGLSLGMDLGRYKEHVGAGKDSEPANVE